MSEKFKIHDQTYPYFVTFTVVKWIDVFTRNCYRDIIIDSLKFCQNNKGLTIYSYCIMTNHLHLIIGTKNGFRLENTVRDFRGFTSKKLKEEIELNPLESRKDWMLALFRCEGKKRASNKAFQLWKRNYHPIIMDSNQLLDQKIQYIHQNPVKAGFVSEPEHYLYSSAVNYAGGIGTIDVEIVD